jgi:hypothetical protein
VCHDCNLIFGPSCSSLCWHEADSPFQVPNFIPSPSPRALFHSPFANAICRRTGKYGVLANMGFLSYTNLPLVCPTSTHFGKVCKPPEVTSWSRFDIGIGFKDSKIVYLRSFEMNPFKYQTSSFSYPCRPHTRALHWVPMPMPMGFGWAWVGMGDMLLFMGGHGWASVLCIQLQVRVKLLGCREYANQEALRAEANNNERLLFVRSNQDLV